MKSPIILLNHLSTDVQRWCSVDLTRDITTCHARYDREGMSFLTITLPAFCKAFDKALAAQEFTRSTVQGFKYPRTGALPEFLQGLLSLVFDRTSGKLLQHPEEAAVWLIRQFLLMFKKVNLDCTDRRVADAFRKYVAVDEEVSRHVLDLTSPLLAEFTKTAAMVFAPRLHDVSDAVRQGQIVPKHGPGTTAEGILGNKKYNLRTWHKRLEQYFPMDQFCVPNPAYWAEMDRIDLLDGDQELPVRVISVPKTLSAPRIIAVEPVCMQYAQQALLEVLVPSLEGPAFHGALGYTDQVPNQLKAYQGSCDGSLATLDLSDASDRVSAQLASHLFEWDPDLRDAVFACRSTHANVPGHGVIRLAKFASMGSALCFPVESMTFLVICLIGMAHKDEVCLSAALIQKYLRQIRIYGDDIIVPTDYALTVIDYLEVFGLKVNRNKSFWSGSFRESCGRDFYAGYPVQPVYLRRMLPYSRQDAESVISAVSFRNQLFEAGLWATCDCLTRWIESIAPFPVVGRSSPVLGRHSYVTDYEVQRESKTLHRPEVRGIKVRAPVGVNSIDGIPALMKFFLKRGDMPVKDKDHLQRSGRPRRVYTQVAWDVAY